jgi:hypothetical protein
MENTSFQQQILLTQSTVQTVDQLVNDRFDRMKGTDDENGVKLWISLHFQYHFPFLNSFLEREKVKCLVK